MPEEPALTTRLLDAGTWPDFAALAEANNGVWGGCWCMGFHAEGFADPHSPERNRAAKEAHARAGTVHQVLVYDGDACVGWAQFGRPVEVPRVKNAKAYEADLDRLPDWRIACIFTGSKHRGRGVARAAVEGALAEIAAAGGGLVEAYPEQQEGRPPQRGAYFQTGPESLYTAFGFERVRKIAKWRWVMRREVSASSTVAVPTL